MWKNSLYYSVNNFLAAFRLSRNVDPSQSIYSEMATKIWRYLQTCFDATGQFQIKFGDVTALSEYINFTLVELKEILWQADLQVQIPIAKKSNNGILLPKLFWPTVRKFFKNFEITKTIY